MSLSPEFGGDLGVNRVRNAVKHLRAHRAHRLALGILPRDCGAAARSWRPRTAPHRALRAQLGRARSTGEWQTRRTEFRCDAATSSVTLRMHRYIGRRVGSGDVMSWTEWVDVLQRPGPGRLISSWVQGRPPRGSTWTGRVVRAGTECFARVAAVPRATPLQPRERDDSSSRDRPTVRQRAVLGRSRQRGDGLLAHPQPRLQLAHRNDGPTGADPRRTASATLRHPAVST